MDSIKENSSPKVSAIELIGKNLIDVRNAVLKPLSNLNGSTTVAITPEFQLPLPSKLTCPVILSGNHDEALGQLRYLYEANLITDDNTFFFYTNENPADEWLHAEGNMRHYKIYYDAWVWAEDDIRESRKDDIFRLRRLFAEDESEVEEVEEENIDPRNQREGDTTVFWLVDHCRYIFDFTKYLPYNRAINHMHSRGLIVIIMRYFCQISQYDRKLITRRRHA